MTSAYSGLIGLLFLSFIGSNVWFGLPLVLNRNTLSGPNSLKNVTTPARKPVSSDATVTTVVIPITMPRMVRPERNRLVHTADIAMIRFSRGEMFIYSDLSATMGASFAAFEAGYQPL